MKKLISLALTLIMLAGVLCIPMNAAGKLVHSDDFSMGLSAKNWMIGKTEFKWNDEGYIYGYSAARVLESKYGASEKVNKIFDQFYESFHNYFAIRLLPVISSGLGSSISSSIVGQTSAKHPPSVKVKSPAPQMIKGTALVV